MNKPPRESADLIWGKCLELAREKKQISDSLIDSVLSLASTGLLGQTLVVQVYKNLIDRIQGEPEKKLNQYLKEICERESREILEMQLVSREDDTPLPTLDLGSEEPSSSYDLEPNNKSFKNIPGTNAAQKIKPEYTFENFVPGESAKLAFEASKSVSESLGDTLYNPLFLYGDTGLGKTHLLHAIASYVLENYPGHIVRYTTANNFIEEFIYSLQAKTIDTFTKKFRNVDLLIVDDIQFFAGKEASKDMLFNTFDEMDLGGKQIVLSADQKPADLEDIPERLRSRFMSGLVLEVRPPNLETRIAILQLKTQNWYGENIELDNEAYQYIAENFTDNIRTLEGALRRVIAETLSSRVGSNMNRNVTLRRHNVEKMLESLVPVTHKEPLTPPRILEFCANYMRCSVEELIGPKRVSQIITARHASMYVMREITDLSYPQIGEIFGGRDHSSIMHAVKKIEKQMEVDPTLFNHINELLRILNTQDTKFLNETNNLGEEGERKVS